MFAVNILVGQWPNDRTSVRREPLPGRSATMWFQWKEVCLFASCPIAMASDSNETPDPGFSVEVNPQGVRRKGVPPEQPGSAEPWPETVAGDPATAESETISPPESSRAAPQFLQMALSATRSMAKFVASGLERVDEATQAARLAQCAGCNQYDARRCKLCGCFADEKAWLVHEDCPLGKWPV